MRSLLAACLAALPLCADVTIRYENEMGGSLPTPGMPSYSMRAKGALGLCAMGELAIITDLAKQQITVLDPSRKTFATVPAAQYSEKLLGAIPKEAGDAFKGMANMFGTAKPKTESRKTERTQRIQGVLAEELEVTVTMELAAGAPMKMVMRNWTAKPEELMRVQALRELAAFNAIQSSFLKIGGLGGMMAAFDGVVQTGGVVLRTDFEIHTPMLGDANKPLVRMTQKAVELSSAPLDDSLFAVPKEYTAEPVEQLFQTSIKRQTESAQLAKRQAAPIPPEVKAYVSELNPLERADCEAPPPEAADVQANIILLVTVDPEGRVSAAEALNGPEPLRNGAIKAVKQYRYRPVLRDGKPVVAYTQTSMLFSGGRPYNPMRTDFKEDMAARDRLSAIEQALPRTPQQKLADLEQDAGGGDRDRRFRALEGLAMSALKAGADEKAAAYANEMLKAASQPKFRNFGAAVHDAHMVLGLVALRRGDVAEAGRQLLEAGNSASTPVLGSFGPNMLLAKELLEKGERDVVLRYFSLCRAFWKMGGSRLDSWSETVRNGGMPNFFMNLR